VDGTQDAPQEDTKAPAVAAQDGEDMEGEKDGGGDDGEEAGGGEQQKFVFIGSDVNRSWSQHFDVVEVAAEILANMACLVKNTVLSAATGPAAQDEEEYEDWSDDEESELKMDQIALSSAPPLPSSSPSSAVSDVSTPPPLLPPSCSVFSLGNSSTHVPLLARASLSSRRPTPHSIS
jgi:hypothetical protein